MTNQAVVPVVDRRDTGGMESTRAMPMVVEGEARPVAVEAGASQLEDLYTLTHLIVGAIVEGGAEILALARQWEEQNAPGALRAELDDEAGLDVLLRYALVGLVFDMEERLRRRLTDLGRGAGWSVGATASLAFLPVRIVAKSWLFSPLRRRVDTLSRRGQVELWRLIELGHAEEPASRAMARYVAEASISGLIRYLAQQPEIRELLQEQSTGMANEVVGGVRARTVTADVAIERLVRSLFRKGPREEWPVSSEDVPGPSARQ